MTNPSRDKPSVCWVVTDGRAGIESQALGLAEAIADLTPLEIAAKRIAVRAPWRFLPWRLWRDPLSALSGDARLEPPYPDLWIGCGRLSVPLSIAMKRKAAGPFVVQVQDPRAPSSLFDLVVPPDHDGLVGENVFPIIGSPNRLKAGAAPSNTVAGKPSLAVLIGGPNRAFRLTKADAERLCSTLAGLAPSCALMTVTTSRRTPPFMAAMLRSLSSTGNVHVWIAGEDGQSLNPYPAMLGACDAILVTEDSVNMAVEAASTGKPVHVLPLARKPFVSAAKFDAFHEGLERRGASRRFDGALGDWTYEPLHETRRAAAEILKRWRG